MSGRAIPAILFDLDGTLVDSVEDIAVAANAMLAENEIPPIDLAMIRRFIGNGMAVLVERCFAFHGRVCLDLAEATRRFKHHYQTAGYPRTRLFDGVGAALESLSQQGHRLALCTNKDERAARAIVTQLGIAERFTCVIGGDSVGAHKPDPRPLLAAAAGCDAAIDQLFYVGDSEVDAEASRRAGCRLLLYTGGYRQATVEQLAPFGLFDQFDQLPLLIATLSPAP